MTWDPTVTADDGATALVQFRTRTDGTWSEWADLEYHDEHAPDPGSAEGRQARPAPT